MKVIKKDREHFILKLSTFNQDDEYNIVFKESRFVYFCNVLIEEWDKPIKEYKNPTIKLVMDIVLSKLVNIYEEYEEYKH